VEGEAPPVEHEQLNEVVKGEKPSEEQESVTEVTKDEEQPAEQGSGTEIAKGEEQPVEQETVTEGGKNEAHAASGGVEQESVTELELGLEVTSSVAFGGDHVTLHTSERPTGMSTTTITVPTHGVVPGEGKIL
jgi:hypothetical protein